jgi:hypothetical protein
MSRQPGVMRPLGKACNVIAKKLKQLKGREILRKTIREKNLRITIREMGERSKKQTTKK